MEGSCRGLSGPSICLQKQENREKREVYAVLPLWCVNSWPVDQDADVLWPSVVLVWNRKKYYVILFLFVCKPQIKCLCSFCRGTLFYPAARISACKSLHVTKGSVTLAAVPVGRESGSTRFTSVYCSWYYVLTHPNGKCFSSSCRHAS